MASVTFVLKEPNSSEKTLVYLLFRYNTQKLKYSTGLKIQPKFWNGEKQRVKETRQFPEHSEFNSFLNNVESKVNILHRKLINDNVVPTPEILRSALNEALLKTEVKKKKDFFGFIEDLITTSVKKLNTIKNYQQTLRELKNFSSANKKELKFENIDLSFYDEFVKYCLSKNFSSNTIGGFIKNIKVFMNEAYDRKLTTNTEFRNRRFKTIEEETENIYLTAGEIEKLYRQDLTSNVRLDKVRDMFIIACYTGLRYSDLVQLSDKNLIDNQTKIKIKTEKTGETVVIPLHRFCKEILTKYNGLPNYSISNQKMNEYLKELADLADLNEKILISSTKGGVKQSEHFKKSELITVHTARRSFATNAYLMNIPTISIMKITGHRTEKAFLKYIKISQEENANKLLEHPFFN
jgi:site-specific recombinase XerD